MSQECPRTVEGHIEQRASLGSEGKSMRQIEILSPLTGKVIPLSKVPERHFARGEMGPGIAILPKDEVVYAPFDGSVVAVSHSGHAMLLEGEGGIRLRLQVALESEFLSGGVYSTKVEAGESITKGQILMTFERRRIKRMGYSLCSPIVLERVERYGVSPLRTRGRVEALEPILRVESKACEESIPSEEPPARVESDE